MKKDKLEREIELLEDDDSLTISEKSKMIRELERDYWDAAEESAREAHDNEYNSW
uniref:Uncharacterized protein n=1 Tax=viral metagenome TaxID=1070528 RepID=A0A6M3JJ67_9ZZZZ